METNDNVLTRWYPVPILCFSGCGHIGTFFHVWWICPVVHCFGSGFHYLTMEFDPLTEQADLFTHFPPLPYFFPPFLPFIFFLSPLFWLSHQCICSDHQMPCIWLPQIACLVLAAFDPCFCKTIQNIGPLSFFYYKLYAILQSICLKNPINKLT